MYIYTNVNLQPGRKGRRYKMGTSIEVYDKSNKGMKKEGHEEIRAEGQYGKVKVTQKLRDSRELMQN